MAHYLRSLLPAALVLFFAPVLCNADNLTSKIGVIVPLSGPFARYGEQIRNGINSSQLGAHQLTFEDEGCDPKRAVTSYKKLSEMDGIRVFLGPWCGSPQMAVAPLIRSKKQLAVLGSSAPKDIFRLSGGRIFSSQHTIEDESSYLARQAYRLGARKVAIVFFDQQFSRAHEKAFRENFPGTVAETFAYTSQDISEIKAIVLRIRALAVDSLYVPDAFPLMGGLVKELQLQGLGKLPVFAVYSTQSEDVLTAVGQFGEGIVYSYPDIGDKVALDYFPSLAAELLAAAVKACGSDPECGRNYLLAQHKFTEDGALAGAVTLKTIHQGKFVPFDGNREKAWLEARGMK